MVHTGFAGPVANGPKTLCACLCLFLTPRLGHQTGVHPTAPYPTTPTRPQFSNGGHNPLGSSHAPHAAVQLSCLTAPWPVHKGMCTYDIACVDIVCCIALHCKGWRGQWTVEDEGGGGGKGARGGTGTALTVLCPPSAMTAAQY